MRHRLDGPIRRWQHITRLLDDVRTARVVLVLILGAMGSLPLVILTPPFQAPDEVQHFYRAYQLSEFHIRAEVQNGRAGGTLPDSLTKIVKASVFTQDEIACPATPAPIAKTLQLSSIPLDSFARHFVAFPGSAFYSPLPYLPQVFGISVGRAFGLGPLSLLYLGRLFNCLAALGLVALAFDLMPVAEELVILAGLLPMSLYLYASLSPDAAVIACALLFSALSLSAGRRGNWTTRELCVAAAAAAVFCSVKPVYAPMLLAAVVPGVFRKGEAAKVIRTHLILVGVALGVTAGWLLFANPTMTSPLSGANPPAQVNFILHHPVILIQALAHTLEIGSLVNLYVQGVGVFGWLTVLLRPGIVYVLPLVSLILLLKLGVCGRPMERYAMRGFWYLALASTTGILVVVAILVMWAHAGQDNVAGVQGRYFIPILVLAGMAVIELLPIRRYSAPRWQRLTSIAVIFAVETAAMDTTIIRAFHVF